MALLQNTNLPIGFAQLAAKAEAQVLEQFDLDGGMGFAQPGEVLDAQQITFDFTVGLDYRGAWSAVNDRHLAEGHPGGEGCQTF